MSSKPADGVTLVLVAPGAGDRLGRAASAWADVLAKTGRPYEILAAVDGEPGPTTATLGHLKHVRVLPPDPRRGFGAALRTAVAEAHHPLLVHLAVDDAFAPSDLRLLLDRIDVTDDITGLRPTVVSGCRPGRPTPAGWAVAGRVWRLFCRVALGLPLDPPPTWLGVRQKLYTYWVWGVFGVPLADPGSGLKLWRTEFLKRVPVQSDGDFVHTELVAKATFLTCVVDEVTLPPRGVTRPSPPVWKDMWAVFRDPRFGPSAVPR